MSGKLLEILYDYHNSSFDDWDLTEKTVVKIDALYQSQLTRANEELDTRKRLVAKMSGDAHEAELENNRLTTELSAAQQEIERKRQIINAMQDCVGCGEPVWEEVMVMIRQDAKIIAELQEPIVVDLTNQ